MQPFSIVRPKNKAVPILLSIPHSGVSFPEKLKGAFKKEALDHLDDTDWYVDRLYNFAPEMGITTLSSTYSRWVVDLNRNPNGETLYNDGRITTDLCPVTDFLGRSIYEDERISISEGDRLERLQMYYWPYHHALQRELNELKQRHGKVLLWECHSIRQQVETIYPNVFPDLILGDADGESCPKDLVQHVLPILQKKNYSVSHNHPFKGGYITRQYGRPAEQQYALQLEMTKVNYMDKTERLYDESRARQVIYLLQEVFSDLIVRLTA